MKKLFISQPMSGKTEEEIKAEREKLIEEATKLIKEPVEVIDSFLEDVPDDAKPLWYLGESILLMSTADYVYFAENWFDYKGCRIEHDCAQQYGYIIVRK